ncbi:hypothetical protein [Streptomyces canus]|uniref:hypothetical protein n=1 Tax=Streptomyces canus TaxID=58343 RepID=UPI002E25360D
MGGTGPGRRARRSGDLGCCSRATAGPRAAPDQEFWTEWARAREVRAAATDFRRARLGLKPARHPGRDHESGTASIW